MKSRLFLTVFIVIGLIFNACPSSNPDPNSNNNYNGTLTVTPSSVPLARGETQKFTASESYGVTWLLEGSTGNSNINSSGLLTVGNDETASTLTVRAKKSKYKDGTARVTVASPGQTPSGLKINKPSPDNIQLSWSPMSGVTQYTVQRSTNGKDFGTIGNASGTSYTDNTVAAGASYYYRIQVNGVNSQVVYTFAADYFNMPAFAQRKLIPLTARSNHYYRFAVIVGNEYNIEWQNGNNQDISYYYGMYVDAYQNNGTSIFTDAYNGFTGPKVFTATATGFVTVRVRSNSDSSQNYQIYYY
jgi:hypothetical protein